MAGALEFEIRKNIETSNAEQTPIMPDLSGLNPHGFE